MAEYNENISQELFEQIESYLLNRMDKPARLAFEKSMENNKTLRNEVELQRRLMAAVEVTAFNNAYRSPVLEPVKKAAVRKMAGWRYAAAAMLIIAAGIAWLFITGTPNAQKLFSHYFRPDPGLPVTMSTTSIYAFYDGMVSYKQADYKNAIAIWEGLGTETGFTDTLQYFIGVARLNNDEPAPAISRLLPVAENERSAWRREAVWYLALAYLKKGDNNSAIQWLQELPASEKARELLGKIRGLSSH